MRGVERTGRTVDEAVESALQELGVDRQRVVIEVLEEGNKGFWGLVAPKPARVRVTVKEDGIDKAHHFLGGILQGLGIDATVDVDRAGTPVRFNIMGKGLGTLIGRRGQTLDAVQYLVNLVANREARKDGELAGDQGRYQIVVDAEGYRGRREQALRSLALRVAERVRREGRQARLEPMSPLERRIIHLALQDNKDVTSYSEGEEPYRRIVIVPRRRSQAEV
ncbi:MAG TPA: protein jag [Firmicutes bacterium]|nr:protein jag [Bacillota bacterium]